MSNAQILFAFIITLCYATGLAIRRKQSKSFIPTVDPILILQFLAILLFWCPIFHAYFIGPYYLSLLVAVTSIAIDQTKQLKDKAWLLAIVLPLFVLHLSRLEHWWWSYYASLSLFIAALVFTVLLFRYPKKIEKELPYLIYFVFDILYTVVQICNNWNKA